MKKRERATGRIRVYPSTQKLVIKLAKQEDVTMAQIVKMAVSHSGSFEIKN